MDADRMHMTANSYWEIAFIYAFTIFFDRSDIAPIHPIPFLTPKILEDALLLDTQDILNELMCSFLANALNRKKSIELASSTRLLSEYLNAKLRCQEFELGYNPLSSQDGFKALTPDLKLKILYALVEWQLQDSTSIRTIVDTLYNSTKNGQVNPLVPNPVGHDSKKRVYWQFGDSPYMWRERAHLKSGCEWEIVCRDMDELRQFADKTLEQSKSHKEKKLANHIKDILVPALEEKQKQQEIKDRAKARKLAAVLALETTRELPPRTRRKPTRYNYTEEFMEWNGNDNDDEEEEAWVDSQEDGNDKRNTRSTQQPSTARRATRSSGRLNGDDAIVSYMEEMEIDSQQQQDNDDHFSSSSTSSSTAVIESSENETSESDLDAGSDGKENNGTDDDMDDDIKSQQLLSNIKTWPTRDRKDRNATPGYYEEKIDDDLDIV